MDTHIGSHVVDDDAPDTKERMKLKLAELGECWFAVDAQATTEELYDKLEF